MKQSKFLLQITFFHPWKDYKTTRKFPLRNLLGMQTEEKLVHADRLLTDVAQELYYISGGQGMLEGKIFCDKNARIIRPLHDQYPPPDGNRGYVFLDYVLAIKFEYRTLIPRSDGTVFRKSGLKTINIPSLFDSPLVLRGTKDANKKDTIFQQFLNRFGETGNLGLDQYYDSWGNIRGSEFKMLASVKKANKRGARKTKPQKSVSSDVEQSIYLIHIHKDIYKIGQSKNPNKRLKTLQTSSPYKLVLVHSFSADNVNAAEQELHNRLSHVRQEGEWFMLLPEQKELICRIAEYKDGCFWTDEGQVLDEKFSIVTMVANS